MPWTVEPSAAASGAHLIVTSRARRRVGLMRAPSDGLPPRWLPQVWVHDASEAAPRAEALGAEIVSPVRPTPGHDAVAIIHDPLGSALALVTPREHRR